MSRYNLLLVGDTVLAFLAATAFGGIASMLTGRNLTVSIYIFGAALVSSLLVFWFDSLEMARRTVRVLCGVGLALFCLTYLAISFVIRLG